MPKGWFNAREEIPNPTRPPPPGRRRSPRHLGLVREVHLDDALKAKPAYHAILAAFQNAPPRKP